MRRQVRPEQSTNPAPKPHPHTARGCEGSKHPLVPRASPGAASLPHHHARHMPQAGFQACTQQIYPRCSFRATPWAVYVLTEPSKGHRKRGCLFSLTCLSITQHQRAATLPDNTRGYPPAAKRASAGARHMCLLPRNRTGEGEEQIGEERSG